MLSLIEASTTGELVAVQRLLAANPRHLSLDERDCHNGTALIHASYRGFADIVLLLVAANAGVNLAADDGTTPLLAACQEGQDDCVRQLLAATAINVNQQNTAGATALMHACEFNHAGCVGLLLKADGIDVNVSAHDGTTALLVGAHFPFYMRFVSFP